jgi:hypothetical protein
MIYIIIIQCVINILLLIYLRSISKFLVALGELIVNMSKFIIESNVDVKEHLGIQDEKEKELYNKYKSKI